MSAELKPCPFCGGKAQITKHNYKTWRLRAECENRNTTCPVNMRTHHHDEEEDVIEAWNTRP